MEKIRSAFQIGAVALCAAAGALGVVNRTAQWVVSPEAAAAADQRAALRKAKAADETYQLQAEQMLRERMLRQARQPARPQRGAAPEPV